MMDLDEEVRYHHLAMPTIFGLQVVIAYVSNGLKTGMGELTGTYRHLRDAVFECVEKSKTISQAQEKLRLN